MEKKFRNICAEHGLACVSVTFHNMPNDEFMTVFVHWDANGIGKCASGRGSGFDEALSNAIDAKKECIANDVQVAA